MKYADVIIHLNNIVSSAERDNLLDLLKSTEGVITAKFSEQKEHLVLLSYNPEITTALVLLNSVKEKGFESQRVGL